jgi:Protein of unknown function (DUF1361)
MRPETRRWGIPGALWLWCTVLLALRVARSGTPFYLFLCWNLFLAWIPWWAGQAFHASSRRRASAAWQLAWLALWLLFLPNAPYILTDLLHLTSRPPVPLWFDLALLLSYAGTGLLLGYVSLLDVHAALEERSTERPAGSPPPARFSCRDSGSISGGSAAGTVGRRLTEPVGILRDISDRLLDPASHPHPLTVTLVFGGGLFLGYAAPLRLLTANSAPQPLKANPPRPFLSTPRR